VTVNSRTFTILDSAPLRRGQLAVLELDAPNPLPGLLVGSRVEVVFRDGSRERVELKSLGFASSTPDHAHVVVSMPLGDVSQATHLEAEIADQNP
jgi:hypothetical protein